MENNKQTFGLIISTRSFFPSHLVKTAREQITKKLDELGYGYVTVDESMTKCGAVMTFDEALTAAKLFEEHKKEISGIIVVLPNFGEELGIAEAIDRANLDVPVLVQAIDDDFEKLDMANRRDAFCGKISLCNNLYYRDIKYTLTTLHTCKIDSTEFTEDLKNFVAVCRVVNGVRGSRIAMLGARPVAFNTVRFSEKILQHYGISVQTVDMSEIIFEANKLSDKVAIGKKIEEIKAYGKVAPFISQDVLEKQARLCITIEEFVKRYKADASTVQCWDSVENNYGCATCLAMSMLGEKGLPSACESDVTGAVSMLMAHLATNSPAALMDWNNNVREDRNNCVCIHCSNFPKSFFESDVEIECLDVLGSTLGKENCFGAVKGQVGGGDMTYFRVTTDDRKGVMKAYVGEGTFETEEIPTKGGIANCRVKNLQELLKYICENGFEHHVCFVRGHVAKALSDACKYLGIEVYRHR